MSRTHLFAAAIALLSAPASAEVPQVVTDIAPVHALVAQVMDGVGEPALLVRPGMSPHTYALRPSQARALQEAGLVVWVGPNLTPWLEKPLETLAGDAVMLTLLEQEATGKLVYRESGGDHGDHGEHADHEEHGDHADHGADEGDHDDHDHDHDHHGHDHHGLDPHAWLDPENGRIWLGLIADRLARLDPEHGDIYRANAAAGQAQIAQLETELAATLAPMQGRRFVAFHDAYQYFEARFGLTLAGTVSPGDASDPSPARMAALRDTLVAQGVACAFTEPQFNTGLLAAAVEGQGVKVLVLDPLGSTLEPGASLYPALLRDMGQTFAACAED